MLQAPGCHPVGLPAAGSGVYTGLVSGEAFRVSAGLLSFLVLLALPLALPAQEPVQRRLTLAQVWTLDAIYTDPQHGVTFRYPSTWQAEMQFGYNAPALTESGDFQPIAGFSYQEGYTAAGPYMDTNLQGFGVVYAAIPTASAAECDTKAIALTEFPKRSRIVLGGRRFSAYFASESGMSQSISGELYATFAQGTCYLFETDMTDASTQVLEDVRGLTRAQVRGISANLLKIMKSVRIAPRGRN